MCFSKGFKNIFFLADSALWTVPALDVILVAQIGRRTRFDLTEDIIFDRHLLDTADTDDRATSDLI